MASPTDTSTTPSLIGQTQPDQPSHAHDPAQPRPAQPRSPIPVFARNSIVNILRTGALGLVSILLPTYLTHHLPVSVYGAWVLVLQLGAYVAYLDMGVQTALSKFIAEYEARQDLPGCGRCATVALRIMLVAALLGIALTLLLALRIPNLFHDMPVALIHDVRISVLLVGISLSIGLATSVFSGIFLGLQRYQIPTAISVLGRVLYALTVWAAVSRHRGLITMAVATACVNLLTSLAEIAAWKRFAGHIRVSMRTRDAAMLRQMLAYCGILTVWSACMLFISGLDVTIVGRYAFDQVAFYSIGNSPTNMILMIFGAITAPLLPALSAIGVDSSPDRMGSILLRSTRYSTVILLATGLPILVGGYPLLKAWVGPNYALHSVLFLDVLLIANILRNLCAPYATMVVATARQLVATTAAVAEGLVNITASILLARHLGAIGVALGTLIGAFTGLAAHFAISMHYTQANFAIPRRTLLTGGILRPAVMALPSFALATLWWGNQPQRPHLALWTAWAIATLALAWFVSLSGDDRIAAQFLVRRALQRRPRAVV